MQKKLCGLFFIVFLSMLILSGCADESDSEPAESNDSIPQSSAATIPEHRVIELFADLSAQPTELEGVWESACKKSGGVYFKNRRVHHLNGVFKEVAEFNDANCVIHNSRNTARLFGTITATDTLQLSNGTAEVDVQQITSSLMIAPTTGRPIPLAQITLADLVPHSTAIEIFKIVENRMYIANNPAVSLEDLLADNESYLTNSDIIINGKTDEEIDQQAIALFQGATP